MIDPQAEKMSSKFLAVTQYFRLQLRPCCHSSCRRAYEHGVWGAKTGGVTWTCGNSKNCVFWEFL